MNGVIGLWFIAIAAPAACFLGEVACLLPGPRRIGALSLFLLEIKMVCFFTLLVALPTCVVSLAVAVWRWREPAQLAGEFLSTLACVAFAILLFVSFGASQHIRHDAFARAGHRGMPIVRALAAYREDHGHYPEALAELVPGYLDRLPSTGLMGYPKYWYRKGYHDLERAEESYELLIHCTSTIAGINFDRFLYWPEEAYPATIQRKVVERIGVWAYVHE
jgi:hypothetical protein